MIITDTVAQDFVASPCLKVTHICKNVMRRQTMKYFTNLEKMVVLFWGCWFLLFCDLFDFHGGHSHVCTISQNITYISFYCIASFSRFFTDLWFSVCRKAGKKELKRFWFFFSLILGFRWHLLLSMSLENPFKTSISFQTTFKKSHFRFLITDISNF